MKSRSTFIWFSLIRLAVFIIPLAVLLAIGTHRWLSIIFAALFGTAVSLVFLRRPREQIAQSLYRARHPEVEPVDADADIEDKVLDRVETNHNPNSDSA